jgi:hypothetical protein
MLLLPVRAATLDDASANAIPVSVFLIAFDALGVADRRAAVKARVFHDVACLPSERKSRSASR